MEPAGTSEVRSRGIRIMQQTTRWRRESTHPWVASFENDELLMKQATRWRREDTHPWVASFAV